MANLVRTSVSAGIAVAGAGFWLANSPDTPGASAAPGVQLASVESVREGVIDTRSVCTRLSRALDERMT